MPSANVDRLRGIKTLPQLTAYLHDELDWPISPDSVDDVTFDYDPAELGFDAKSTVHIKEVKQIRPLHPQQPWGVFWVNFERKRLPVVMLRRALGHLVVKKRAVASNAVQRAWQMNDLLFISSYGENHDRAITFAHFSQDQGAPRELPVLKVLGWDDADTVLHLAAARRSLTENLRWPENPADVSGWREQWTSAFTLGHREVITTTEQLVEELARLATKIREAVLFAVSRETDKGPWRRLLSAFQASLLHYLNEESFADVIAQTISYGLLTARFSSVDKITLQNLVDMVPRTNPFLKELLGDFVISAGRRRLFDVDEVGINEVVGLLNRAQADAIKNDFGKKTRGEDPVIHFYEHFLSAYNKQLKIQRGVFYTPQPVVSYIVRSVHELLQTEFGLADGLADTTTWGEMVKKHPGFELPLKEVESPEKGKISSDEPFVQVLDPATGTATFLVEVIDIIHITLTAKWEQQRLTDTQQRAAWNDYVPKHLLPRLHAFELMMAPYAIAHMRIGLKLAETGFDAWQNLRLNDRARIYLTNALEPWQSQLKLPDIEALAHEAEAVNEIKWHKRFTVVIGNPPYSVSSQNDGKWIVELCSDFKTELEGERNIQPLSDDYVKFWRLALFNLEQSDVGVIGMITNREYIQGIIHRSLRRKLLDSSSSFAVFDLHGQRGELLAAKVADENVFDIEKGVAIGIISRRHRTEPNAVYGEALGTRSEKTAILSSSACSTTCREQLTPTSPYWFLKPWNVSFKDEYYSHLSIVDYLPKKPVTGFATHRDHFAIGFAKEDLVRSLATFLDLRISDDVIAAKFNLADTRDWQLHRARLSARRDKAIFERIRQCTYRPFDNRWIIYSDDILEYSRRDAMQQLSQSAPALICARIVKDEAFAHVFISQYPVEKISLSPKSSNNAQVCLSKSGLEKAGQDSFLSSDVRWVVPTTTRLPSGADVRDILHYAYAVFHSPSYRSRYAEFLKIDFPRLPLTGNLELFGALARRGGELTSLHLLESPKLDKPITDFTGGRNPEVEKISWSRNTVWVDKAETAGFQGVREDVWNFHIGGYQVCQKWLKDRKGRTLSKDDITHYQKIVVALSETIRLMKEIDEVIEEHGGWPLAFSQDPPNPESSSDLPFA